ncbi:hypothetical protein MZO42_17775 [Sphingomonas psychrotolerans]|uniref:Uncharacterized protein n=1 Tax=Sphingomonas psychrotolerans TaxID=1327635 RepID=A0ABU3N9L0_9SPHN|nr:hypothetical protein [Sphingomonas psychrotolerans]MDT8760554.1 hypothetical protein [Sphingomonas psychrotolerans]
MSAEGNRIEIDAIDFQISCRRFMVRATITRDRHMPLVDEYVLRLLAILDRMQVSRMRAWFGFSEAEIEAVLVDMGRQKLIEFDGDDVVLAPAGRELFKTVGEDGAPRVVEVVPLVGDVWFDLVSRNMVPRSRAPNADYLVRLTEQQSARELPETFARQAFEQNFRDYARRIRKLPDPDAVNLYSISEVEGGAYGHQLLPAKLVLDTDKLTVRNTFTELGSNAPAFAKLTVAANDAWQTNTAPETTSTAAAEFDRMTGPSVILPVIEDPTDAEAWVSLIVGIGREEGTFIPSIGATYLPANISRLLETLQKDGRGEETLELTWLRPNGSTWGRTTRVPDALQQIRATARNVGRHEIHTTLAMPRSTSKPVRKIHRRLFDTGLLLPQRHLPANLEVLLVPGVAALVNVHVPVGMHSVPIGGLTKDPRRLARIAERLKAGSAEGWEEIWRPSKQEHKRPER